MNKRSAPKSIFSARQTAPHAKHHPVKKSNGSGKNTNSGRRSTLIPTNPLANNAYENPATDAKLDTLAPRTASSMTQNEIMKNLTVRGIKPSGFWEDDAETLQTEFAKEFRHRLKARSDSLEKEAENLVNQQRYHNIARANKLAVFEEENALKRRPELRRWLDLVAQNKCEPTAVFRLRPVLIRCILKGLPATSCLRSLQLARNKLTDRVSRHIGRMLEVNKSLRQLDLSGNLLGPSTATQLAHALETNSTLQTIDISDNPITVGNNGRDLSGIGSLSSMLAVNKSLLCFNVSSAGLGSKGGSSLASGVGRNTTLIILEALNNAIDFKDEEAITMKLVGNRKLRAAAKARMQLQMLSQRREEILQEKKRVESANFKEEEKWIAQRRQVRVEARRQVAEEEREKRIQARMKLQASLKAQAEEADRLAKQMSRKKRKGRKRKKKKKKKKMSGVAIWRVMNSNCCTK